MARVASVTDFDHVTHGAPALRPQPSVCNFAGAARALFGRRDGTASVAILAAAYVSHPPVRGGVLDAPRSCDRRADLYAPVRRDQPHPRHPRCARLASTAQRIQFRGHSPRTILYGRTHVIRSPTPGGRGSPPLRCVGKVSGVYPRRPQPLIHGASRRDSSPFRGAEGWVRRNHVVRHPTPGGWERAGAARARALGRALDISLSRPGGVLSPPRRRRPPRGRRGRRYAGRRRRGL